MNVNKTFKNSFSLLLVLLSTNLVAQETTNQKSKNYNIENKIKYRLKTKKNKENISITNQKYILLLENLNLYIYKKKIDEEKYKKIKNHLVIFLKNKNFITNEKKINLLFHLYLLNNKFITYLKFKNIKTLHYEEENKKIKNFLDNCECDNKHLKKIIKKL